MRLECHEGVRGGGERKGPEVEVMMRLWAGDLSRESLGYGGETRAGTHSSGSL